MSILWETAFIFVLAAAAVWWAGTRLPAYVVALSEKTGVGQGLAGMLVLGGITSLPEFATGTTAAAIGVPLLSLNDILGSASLNLLLLALADMALGEKPLTSVVARPVTLIQGVLGMTLFALVGAAIGIGGGDWGGPASAWSIAIFGAVVVALFVSGRAERRPMWQVVNPPDLEVAEESRRKQITAGKLALVLAGLASIILVGGVTLANAGETIAEETGLGTGIVGLLIIAVATSLPEASAIIGAMRHKRYELAIGEIFGSNMFNLAIILAIDLVAPGQGVIEQAGGFEIAAAMLALVLTGVFVIGLIERRDRTVLRMGQDSITAILIYFSGVALLVSLAS
ncbi:sodium:calcium antiporter [Altererythrobacter lutimaris]|uniref:Sodium:calcium antiporter n=1 Tax=Altererythrobacter lutimaris TaxID=2743979 RepID=A0A850HFW3_9SPHN|nr:sodium:calcium antiporter [Altererythrobacter lutimaris]NVE96018.1 sodium:calcium antiporter [Altererythrobacter lutimaris]